MLVEVLGLPFNVETEELKYYMQTFGDVDDCIVMKDRMTGQSRGFGYVTFRTVEDARKAATSQHVLNGRSLDVKIATPKDEMVPSASRKVSRIFVARIPSEVTEGAFRSHFEKYGTIIDAYMPKDAGSRSHRGIGFITFDNPESVDRIMNETHELGGVLVAVDRATPKEETLKSWASRPQYDQPGNQVFEQWTKGLPEQWSKNLPEQWSKIPPEQFSFYMAAAAAAMAQMGAFGGMGGSMEGFDFSSYGFPGYTQAGEVANNASGDAAKGESGQGQSSPSQSHPSAVAGYQPQGSEAQITATSEQSNAVSAYGPSAFMGMMYSMFNGYGGNASSTSMPPVYADSHATIAGGNPAASFGHTADYSTPPVTQGYYGHTSGDATAQAYGHHHGLGAIQSGSTVNADYSSGTYVYGGMSASGHGYDSGNAYVDPNVPNPAYGSSAPYAGAGPVSGAGYASSTVYEPPSAGYGSNVQPASAMGNKVFIGKLPHDATSEHLRNYFSSFGRIADVYVPKDSKKSGHRGFGFVTFFDDGVAERVAQQSHEILGHSVNLIMCLLVYKLHPMYYFTSFVLFLFRLQWIVRPRKIVAQISHIQGVLHLIQDLEMLIPGVMLLGCKRNLNMLLPLVQGLDSILGIQILMMQLLVQFVQHAHRMTGIDHTDQC
ncbi:hypothetical protein KP509_39G011900 [Ceratopteris richardii]|uniref:RRM domain-containing protein n=1 Tax=Ceratopteris richardii TaxID=49495 RepID=A0A8T2PYN7_CERRI|nr:hypothetical protein KP509_39G011900 [Ceratopteris richardii]